VSRESWYNGNGNHSYRPEVSIFCPSKGFSSNAENDVYCRLSYLRNSS
jgi:hypothetical protein